MTKQINTLKKCVSQRESVFKYGDKKLSDC